MLKDPYFIQFCATKHSGKGNFGKMAKINHVYTEQSQF